MSGLTLNEQQKSALIQALLGNQDGNNDSVKSNQDKAKLLSELRELYLRKTTFQPGDLIKWKPNMKNRKYPEYDEPGIIVEVLSTPILDEKEDSGSPYFNELYDIKVAILQDKMFVMFHFDSNRFELFKPE